MNTTLHKNHIWSTLLILGMVVLAILPFWGHGGLSSLFQANQTVYLLVLSGLFGVVFAVVLLSRSFQMIRLGYIDLALLVVTAYYLANSFFLQTSPTVSSRLYDLLGLVLIYMLVRSIGNLYVWPILILPILGGLVQVVYGELQLFGIYPSLHPRFPITGSFFNPGPYAGYLAIIFPAALGTYTYLREWSAPWSWSSALVKYGALAACLGVLLVLSATGSRAAWLAVVLSTAFFYANCYGSKSLERYLTTRSKKFALVVLALTLLLLTLSGMYLIRKDSADGRLLIWKASWGIVQEHILLALGLIVSKRSIWKPRLIISGNSRIILQLCWRTIRWHIGNPL